MISVVPIQKTAPRFPKPQSEQEFREMVLQCIERGLDMFGENTTAVIFWYLAQQKGIQRDAIVNKPEEFIKEVESFFGVGSGKIRRSINRELSSAFDLSYSSHKEVTQISLEQLIADARKRSLGS